MPNRKIILVTGATGGQGGSVARQLLEEGTFKVRALTRNPNSEKAVALASAGAEIVQGDLSDPDSIVAAVKGCYGVFGVTNYWEHFDNEYELGRHLVDAVAADGIEHFVFSSLPDSKKLSKGEFPVPHFDYKARLENEIREAGLKATFIHVAFYYENFMAFFPPRKTEDGGYGFGFPQGDTKLAGVAVEDIGPVVARIFESPDKFIGRLVGIVGDDLTGTQYAEIMSRELGRKVSYNHIPHDVFASFGFPGADDLANMFAMNAKFIPERSADIAESRKLNPNIRTFEQWVKDNKENLLGVLDA